MNYNYFLERYNYYSERIVDNYEFRLAEYIMIDLDEASEENYFVNYQLESFYLEDLHDNLNIEINNFLYQQNLSNAYDDITRNLLIEFVLLLKKVDYKILALPIEIRTEMEIFQNEIKLENSKSEDLKSEELRIILYGDKKKQEKIIIELHKLLIENQLIKIDKSEFKKHFEEDLNLTKIVWHGTQTEIASLFFSLNRDKIIVNKNIYKLAVQHFCDKKENKYNNRRLSSANTKKAVRIDKLMNDLKQALG